MPIETEGQFGGINYQLVHNSGDTGTSLQGWEMSQNDYPGFDPERSYLQNYGTGQSFNDMDGVGAQTIAPTGNRGA